MLVGDRRRKPPLLPAAAEIQSHQPYDLYTAVERL